MKLASYAATMAAVGGAGLALMAYGGEPLPEGRLDGLVAPGSTLGAAVAVLGTWVIGIGTTLLGGTALTRLAWDIWWHWRGLRQTEGRTTAGWG